MAYHPAQWMHDVRVSSVYIKVIFVTLFLLAGVLSYSLFAPVAIPEEGATFYIKSGSSRSAVIKELSKKKYIHLGLLFNIYVHLNKTQLKAGEYFFPQYSSSYTIWKQITNGRGYYYRSFTIIPGWTFKQIREALHETATIKPSVQLMSDKELMEALGDHEHGPEGMFMPETYYYMRDDVDIAVLKRAYDLMQKKLNELWEDRSKELPYKSSYEALTAASLIEKETHLAQERPVISGVLVNRLNKDMLLQFDPTVIYGMGDRYNGTIYKQDLIADTPYNTYMHKGLPPTPIAIPSYDSLVAAMHPQKNDYLYFVAKGDGSHQFSKTLDAHQEAVKKAAEIREKQAFNTTLIRAYLQKAMANIRFEYWRRHAARKIH